LSPINLFTYKLKMCYSHPHPPTHPYLFIYLLDLPLSYVPTF
jgi:hypothetical protein